MAALEGVSINKGNLKALLYVISHNNKPLRNHLETCAKNSTYISKRNLNALLECIKNYMEGRIIDKIISTSGRRSCRHSNWEQLCIVLEYVKDDRPIKKLLECVKCPNICDETATFLIIKALNELALNIKKCKVQIYNGTGNMAKR